MNICCFLIQSVLSLLLKNISMTDDVMMTIRDLKIVLRYLNDETVSESDFREAVKNLRIDYYNVKQRLRYLKTAEQLAVLSKDERDVIFLRIIASVVLSELTRVGFVEYNANASPNLKNSADILRTFLFTPFPTPHVVYYLWCLHYMNGDEVPRFDKEDVFPDYNKLAFPHVRVRYDGFFQKLVDLRLFSKRITQMISTVSNQHILIESRTKFSSFQAKLDTFAVSFAAVGLIYKLKYKVWMDEQYAELLQQVESKVSCIERMQRTFDDNVKAFNDVFGENLSY